MSFDFEDASTSNDAVPNSVSGSISRSMSPISHLPTLHPNPNPTPELNTEPHVTKSKYSKQEMVYRAIDDKIHLVRFLQAYESVLAIFGVDGTGDVERERDKLEVVGRIVYRLFCRCSVGIEFPQNGGYENTEANLMVLIGNDGDYAEKSGSASLPLVQVVDRPVTTGANSSRAQRVTSSEMNAISAIVDEAYEGLHITAASAVDITGKKDEIASTVTNVSEVVGDTGALMVGNATSGIVEEPLSMAGPGINIMNMNDEMIPIVTEMVELPGGTDTSLVGNTSGTILDEDTSIASGHLANTIGGIGQIFSNLQVTQVTQIPSIPDAAIISEATTEAIIGGPSTVVSINSDEDKPLGTFYEESMKNPKILLLRRWGCKRYHEWSQKNRTAEDENARKEVFRLIELKHRLSSFIPENPPYTYRVLSSTRHHRDSYFGSGLFGYNIVGETEKFLHVRLGWRFETGIHNEISIKPKNPDGLAADDIHGHTALQNAYTFLEFWDWVVRDPKYFECAKVRPMHNLCSHWFNPNSSIRQDYFERRIGAGLLRARPSGSRGYSAERGRRDRLGSRDSRGWRGKRMVSGGRHTRGKKRTASGHKEDGLNKGRRKVKRRMPVGIMCD
ncbi:hypothetical protein NHQ30_011471 [Ciborinia camelliae]|nr:hypothetical protein NHQ30_011471 [Ciborinia camelliae]